MSQLITCLRPPFIAALRTLLPLWNPLRTFSHPFVPHFTLVSKSQNITLIDYALAVNHTVQFENNLTPDTYSFFLGP
jgi:hypothetical protein